MNSNIRLFLNLVQCHAENPPIDSATDFRNSGAIQNDGLNDHPSNWHNEDGFEFALFPAKNGKAKNLVVVLHGHGSNTDNWAAHAKQMQAEMPDADIITVQGPVKLPLGRTAFRAIPGPLTRARLCAR